MLYEPGLRNKEGKTSKIDTLHHYIQLNNQEKSDDVLDVSVK
ncbi:hypothetical protein [Virgibacillus ainsalahensis]